MINKGYSKSIAAKDYYDSEKRKIGDVLLGLFGNWIIWWIVYYIQVIFYRVNYIVNLYLLILIVDIAALVYFQRIGRRYIVKGIALSIIAPIILGLLVLGACLIVIAGIGYGFK